MKKEQSHFTTEEKTRTGNLPQNGSSFHFKPLGQEGSSSPKALHLKSHICTTTVAPVVRSAIQTRNLTTCVVPRYKIFPLPQLPAPFWTR